MRSCQVDPCALDAEALGPNLIESERPGRASLYPKGMAESLKPGDEIWIGPVGPIRIRDESDPEFTAEQAGWHGARVRAYAMQTVEDHLAGLKDPDWRCRHEVIDRLVARGRDDPRTLPALLKALRADEAWQVRDRIAFMLHEFPAEKVETALRQAKNDLHPEVQWSARYSLTQLGLSAD